MLTTTSALAVEPQHMDGHTDSLAVQPRHVDGHVNFRAQRVTSQTICAVVHLWDARSADSNTPDRRSSKASRMGDLGGAVSLLTHWKTSGPSLDARAAHNSAAEHHKAMAALVQQLSAHANARSDATGHAERRAESAAADACAQGTFWGIGGGASPKHSQFLWGLAGGSSSKNPWQISRSPGTQEPTHSLSSAALSCWRSLRWWSVACARLCWFLGASQCGKADNVTAGAAIKKGFTTSHPLRRFPYQA